MLLRIAGTPDKVWRAIISLNDRWAQTFERRAVDIFHRRAEDVFIWPQDIGRGEDPDVVATVIGFPRRVKAERRISIELAVGGNARIAIPKGLAGVPGDIAASQD